MVAPGIHEPCSSSLLRLIVVFVCFSFFSASLYSLMGVQGGGVEGEMAQAPSARPDSYNLNRGISVHVCAVNYDSPLTFAYMKGCCCVLRLCVEGRATTRPLPPDVALGGAAGKIATWLILPVVICLSQRLSHACLSINIYTVKLRMAH